MTFFTTGGSSPGAPRVTRSRRVRVRAALIALAFLTASLFGALHEAATAHVRCAEHGELIDSDGPVPAVAAPASDAIAPAKPSARGHGDDHCLVAAATRASRIVPVSPALAQVVVTVDDLVLALSAPARATAASLYRLAPKTSPPV